MSQGWQDSCSSLEEKGVQRSINYRNISLLNVLGKEYERALIGKVKSIRDEQVGGGACGFRNGEYGCRLGAYLGNIGRKLFRKEEKCLCTLLLIM